MFGVDVRAEREGAATDIGEIERLLYGTGFFGAASNAGRARMTQNGEHEGYVEVTQMWEAPCSYGGPGEGRRLGRRALARDDARSRAARWRAPAAFPHTSPLNTFEFVRIPGRNGGTTPVEALTPIQRAYNAAHGMVREHVNLNSNPKAVIDQGSGSRPASSPTSRARTTCCNAAPACRRSSTSARPRSRRTCTRCCRCSARSSTTSASRTREDTSNPGDSGEKVKEVRFNTDRFLGPTMRRSAGEYGRVFANWRVMLPLIWDMETTISLRGRRQHRAHDHRLPRDVQGGRREHPPRRGVDAARGPRRAAGAGLQVLHERDVRLSPARRARCASFGRWRGCRTSGAPRSRAAFTRRRPSRRTASSCSALIRARCRCSSGTTTKRISPCTRQYMASPRVPEARPDCRTHSCCTGRRISSISTRRCEGRCAAAGPAIPPLPTGRWWGRGRAERRQEADQPSGPGDRAPAASQHCRAAKRRSPAPALPRHSLTRESLCASASCFRSPAMPLVVTLGAAPGSAPALVGEGGQIVVMPGTGAAICPTTAQRSSARVTPRARRSPRTARRSKSPVRRSRARTTARSSRSPSRRLAKRRPSRSRPIASPLKRTRARPPRRSKRSAWRHCEARTPEEIAADEQAEAEAAERRVTLTIGRRGDADRVR
jgi:hypothetical protein